MWHSDFPDVVDVMLDRGYEEWLYGKSQDAIGEGATVKGGIRGLAADERIFDERGNSESWKAREKA